MTQTTKPATEGGGAVAVERRSRFATLDWRRYVIYIGFVVIFIFFAILLGDQGFLSPNNLLNILRQTATITVIAVGMTYVIACAEIDLSVGSVAGLASVVTAMAVANWGVVAGVIAGLLVGVVVGSINGGLVAGLGIPSFLVTLGMLGIAFGMAQWITDSAPQPILSYAYNLAFGSGNLGPFPGLVVWMAIFVAVGAIVLSKTRFGRQVLATGGNRMAAEFTGINTKRIKFEVLLISGIGGRLCRHALRRAAAVGPIPMGTRRRAVGHRSRHPGWHQSLRWSRLGDRHALRRTADWIDQQRPDPGRFGRQPAAGDPRRDHHPCRCSCP